MQVYCHSCQEVFDTVIQAFEVSQRVLVPAMVMLDGFFLSHTYEDMELPEPELVRQFLTPISLPQRIDLDRPATLGSMVSPDRFMEFRKKLDLAHEQALEVWQTVDKEWQALTGPRLWIGGTLPPGGRRGRTGDHRDRRRHGTRRSR